MDACRICNPFGKRTRVDLGGGFKVVWGWTLNRYSEKSLGFLRGCDFRLQETAQYTLQIIDHSILEGYRPEELQLEYFNAGLSKVKKGKHNVKPSKALHAAPYPVKWPEHTDDPQEKAYRVRRFYYFAGIFIAVGEMLGYKIRWGGDWNWRDRDLDHQKFNDLCHFEIAED